MPKLPRSASGSRSSGKSRSRGGNGKPADKKAAAAAAKDGDRHARRPVDATDGNGAVTTTIELNDFETGLLNDLFAVVEEHAGDAADQIDRSRIERAFVFACERHAD